MCVMKDLDCNKYTKDLSHPFSFCSRLFHDQLVDHALKAHAHQNRLKVLKSRLLELGKIPHHNY